MKKLLAAGALAFASVGALAAPSNFVLTADTDPDQDKYTGTLYFHDGTFDLHFGQITVVNGEDVGLGSPFTPGFIENFSTDERVEVGGKIVSGDQEYFATMNFTGSRFDYSLDFGQPNPTVTTGEISSAVPEPETYALMLAGLAAVGAAVRSRSRRSVQDQGGR